MDTIILFSAIAANIFLALIVWNYGPRTNVRVYFVQFIAVQILWITANNIAFNVSGDNFLIWTRLTMFFATSHIFFFFQFIFVFLKQREMPIVVYLFFLFMLSAVSLLTLTPTIFSHLELINGALVPVPGLAMPIFGTFVALFAGSSVYIVTKSYFKSNGADRARWLYMALGLISTIILVIAFSFGSFIVTGSLTSVQLGHVYTLPFVMFTAYAVIGYQLFDIRPLVARAVSFVVFITIVVALYAVVMFVAATYIFDTKLTLDDIILNVAVVTAIALTFPLLRNGVSKLTENIFYKGRYNPEKLLSDMSKIMARTLELDDMSHKILRILSSRMKIEKSAFFIVYEHEVTEMKQVGYDGKILIKADIEKALQRAERYPYILFRETQDIEIKNMMRDYDIALLIPMYVGGEVVANLAVGPKLSGEVYIPSEINFLTLVASEVGIAIQNAKAYERIKEFSEELEQKVEERTAQLKKAKNREVAKAKAVAQLKDEFVFIATHELRTPVTAIKGFLELVDNPKNKFPKDVRAHLGSIAMASSNLSQLVNDLLEISRSEAGKMDIDLVPVDIVPLIKSVIRVVKPIADKKKVKVTVRRHKKMPMVLGNEKRLTEVITNLLSNAIKYNKEKGVVDITLLHMNGRVIVEIRDTGFGIPKEEQGKVGNKFFRAVTRDTKTVLGTGLGLFITRMLVEKMGGKLQFSSVEGEGTTFSFSLKEVKN